MRGRTPSTTMKIRSLGSNQPSLGIPTPIARVLKDKNLTHARIEVTEDGIKYIPFRPDEDDEPRTPQEMARFARRHWTK